MNPIKHHNFVDMMVKTSFCYRVPGLGGKVLLLSLMCSLIQGVFFMSVPVKTSTLLQGLKLHSSVTKFYILFTRKCERKNWIGVATKQHTSVTLPLRLGSAPQAHRTLRWAGSRLTRRRLQDLLTDLL